MKYYLLTETEDRSLDVGRGLRYACNDRTYEVDKLFILWQRINSEV